MSCAEDAIEIPDSSDSSDDEGLKPPPASSPENAIEIPDSSDDEGPPPRKKRRGLDGQAAAASAPSPDDRTIAEVSRVDDQPTIAPAPSLAKKRGPYKCKTCGELKKTGCTCKKFAASSISSTTQHCIINSTTQHCTDLKCTAGSCPHLHQCDGTGKERGCQGLWLAPVAFDFKKRGEKRNRRCKECMARVKKRNDISNPIKSAKLRQRAIAYELATQGDQHDLSDAGLRARCEAAINTASELIVGYWKMYPDGFAVIFYGASTGSRGFTVEEEGVSQFRDRGYEPPIIDASGRAPDVALTGTWGPGGVSVDDCGSSKVISHAVEKALQTHFTPICDASDGKMPRLWRKLGAGCPQGIGPYHVCIRIMPLPLPHGWRRSF